MAKCSVTGKIGMFGNKVSHANNKTKKRQEPNVNVKRVWDDTTKRWVRIKISARGLRFLNRMPLSELRRKFSINA